MTRNRPPTSGLPSLAGQSGVAERYARRVDVKRAIELFTKDPKLPLELRSLPYDIDSVLHFGNRDYSKNGHRTMIFKDHKVQQNRIGLTPTDLRKIEIVYGPECLKRDRQEKIELCQSYPGVARRKRSVELEGNRSLRVNPDITPPPDRNITKIDAVLKELGIEHDVQEIVDQVYKVSSLALINARSKYCYTKPDLRIGDINENRSSDILGIVEIVAEYAKNMVDNAVVNMTEFCGLSKSIDAYQRASCPFYDQQGKCRQNYYKSTKFGQVRYSTQHRPVYYSSTKHDKRGHRVYRSGTENNTEITSQDIKAKERKRRHVEDFDEDHSTRGLERRSENDREDKTDVNITDIKDVNAITEDKGDLRMGTAIVGNQKRVVRDRRSEGGRKYRGKKRKTTPPEPEDSESEEDATAPIINKKMKVHELVQFGKLKQTQERLMNKARHEKPRPGRFIPKTIPLSKANKEFYDERKWPENVVRYVISKEDSKKFDIEDMRSRLQEVNRILRKKTCVKLQEISETEAKKYKDYLVMDTSPDYVTGRVGGRQNFGSIELFRGGQHRQHAAMMVMGMLGFYFEVARHDRDKYVRVHMRHVRADKLHHFEKIREDATLALPYDYKSATHPAWQFWRKIGKTGISTVATYKEQDPDGSIMKSLGQNEELLSDIDIVKINSVYGIRCFKRYRPSKESQEETEE